MTISSTTSRWAYTGDGSTKIFAYNNKIFVDADLAVYVAGTLQTLTTDYTVSGAGTQGGGNVTFTTAPSSGASVVIIRDVTADQQTDYPVGGAFPAISTEDALDKLTILHQQQEETLSRVPKFAAGATSSATLGTPVTGRVLYYSSTTQIDPVAVADLSGVDITTGDIIYRRLTVSAMKTDAGFAAGNIVQTLEHTTGYGYEGGNLYLARAVTGGTDDNGSLIKSTGNAAIEFIALFPQGTHHYKQFGAAGDNSADDTTAQTNLFSYLSTNGGGKVIGSPGHIYKTTLLPAMTSNVQFDMRGAEIKAALGSGNVYGLRIGPNNSGVENGTITVTSSTSPSSQYIFHCCITVGEGNGLAGTPSSKGTYAEVKNWFIRNMTLSTARQYCPAIQGAGDIYNGEIVNIKVPDSSTCSGVHLDWGDISAEGTLTSANIPLAKETFLAGDGYTTHPHNIKIHNIECGDLTVTASSDLGSYGVRLSGCYGIDVKNVYMGRCTQAVFKNVGGDLGFEFAPAAVKAFAQKNITAENLECEQFDYQGIFIDTFGDNIQTAVDNTNYLTLSSVTGTFQAAETITGGTSGATATIDNVYNTNTDQLIISSVTGTFQAETITGGTSGATATIAIGYSNILDTVMKGDITVKSTALRGSASDGNVGDGIRLQDAQGVKLIDCDATRGKNGIAVEQRTYNCQIIRGRRFSNLEDGINVEDVTTITNLLIIDTVEEKNGTKTGTYGGIKVNGGDRIKLIRNTVGATDEDFQDFGIVVGGNATNVTALYNDCLEVVNSSGTPFNWGSDSKAYGVMWECRGNEYHGSTATTEIAGVDMIPISRAKVVGDTVIGEFWGAAASLSGSTTPTTGSWVVGDKIYFTDAAAGGKIGSVCTAAGSPGTWKQWGAIDA